VVTIHFGLLALPGEREARVPRVLDHVRLVIRPLSRRSADTGHDSRPSLMHRMNVQVRPLRRGPPSPNHHRRPNCNTDIQTDISRKCYPKKAQRDHPRSVTAWPVLGTSKRIAPTPCNHHHHHTPQHGVLALRRTCSKNPWARTGGRRVAPSLTTLWPGRGAILEDEGEEGPASQGVPNWNASRAHGRGRGRDACSSRALFFCSS